MLSDDFFQSKPLVQHAHAIRSPPRVHDHEKDYGYRERYSGGGEQAEWGKNEEFYGKRRSDRALKGRVAWRQRVMDDVAATKYE